jgi:hypothetical protein
MQKSVSLMTFRHIDALCIVLFPMYAYTLTYEHLKFDIAGDNGEMCHF